MYLQSVLDIPLSIPLGEGTFHTIITKCQNTRAISPTVLETDVQVSQECHIAEVNADNEI